MTSAQQAPVLSAKVVQEFMEHLKPVPLLEKITIKMSDIVKRTRYERVLDTGMVTTYHGIIQPVDTIEDVLMFVHRAAEATGGTEEHKTFNEMEVRVDDGHLEFDYTVSRPATAEELKEAADWLLAHKQEAVKLAIKVPNANNNGDTNND